MQTSTDRQAQNMRSNTKHNKGNWSGPPVHKRASLVRASKSTKIDKGIQE